VLLIVMWLLVLLTAVALGIAATVRTDSGLTYNLREEARARYLAQAGVYAVVLRLLDPDRADANYTADAPVKAVDVLGTPVGVRIVDECGKIDVNTGWGHLIESVGNAAGGDKGAVRVGEAILDWRDPDHRRRLKGAEDDAYADAGRPYGAHDGVIDTIEELQLVLGVTPAIYRRLEPLVTVDCRKPGIDPMVAPAGALAAVPGLDPTALAAFLEVRGRTSLEALEARADALGAGNKYLEISPQQAFTVTATVRLASGIAVAWRAVVWVTGDPTRPYLFRAWKKVPAASPTTDTDQEHPGRREAGG
jgi:general secretion pathway protein K